MWFSGHGGAASALSALPHVPSPRLRLPLPVYGERGGSVELNLSSAMAGLVPAILMGRP